jgi:hypothetical protein
MPEYIRELVTKAGLKLYMSPEGDWHLMRAGVVVHAAKNPEDVATFVKAWLRYVR